MRFVVPRSVASTRRPRGIAMRWGANRLVRIEKPVSITLVLPFERGARLRAVYRLRTTSAHGWTRQTVHRLVRSPVKLPEPSLPICEAVASPTIARSDRRLRYHLAIWRASGVTTTRTAKEDIPVVVTLFTHDLVDALTTSRRVTLTVRAVTLRGPICCHHTHKEDRVSEQKEHSIVSDHSPVFKRTHTNFHGC